MVQPSRSAFFSLPPELLFPGGDPLGIGFASLSLGLLGGEVQAHLQDVPETARSIADAELSANELAHTFERPQVGVEPVVHGALEEHLTQARPLILAQGAGRTLGPARQAGSRVGGVAPSVDRLATDAIASSQSGDARAVYEQGDDLVADVFLVGRRALVVGFWCLHGATHRQAPEQRQSFL